MPPISDGWLFTDILNYIKAYEQVVEEVNPRSLVRKMMDYYSYGGMFVGRYWPFVATIDGVRRINIGEDTQIGLAELTVGLSKIIWDIHRFRTRYTMIALANEHQKKQSLRSIDDITIKTNLGK